MAVLQSMFASLPASVRQGNVIPISESVDPAVAALMEPFACVLRGQNALHIQPGEVVLVIGAGPIGVMHAKLARARGAGRVIVSEPIQERAAQALRMGADRVVDPTSENLKDRCQRRKPGPRRRCDHRGSAGACRPGKCA